MRSCVRYFGGKGMMFKEILSYFPSKNSYVTYIEPFGGGASILFQKEPTPIEIYNDLEKDVYSLFKVLSDKKLFQEFKEKCDLFLYSKSIREEYKQDLKKDDLSLVERAYKYFYVNRTSVNGVGGFASASEIVRRKMSKSVSDFLASIDGLYDIHNRLSKVIIENDDALRLLEKYDRPKAFFYLDPPYHWSTRTEARYKEDMDDDKQEELIKILLTIKKAKVLLSGYKCRTYDRLCKKGWERIDFDVKTQSGNKESKTKIESLWRNYKQNESSNLFD